jgi:hypothetical protein
MMHPHFEEQLKAFETEYRKLSLETKAAELAHRIVACKEAPLLNLLQVFSKVLGYSDVEISHSDLVVLVKFMLGCYEDKIPVVATPEPVVMETE